MSENIDTYVAQAKFDNSGFEENARDTIETLDRLDQGFAKITKHNGKNIFSSFADGIRTSTGLMKKLEKVGEGALHKIGWDGIDFVRRNMVNLFKEATGMNNMIAGWSRYGQEIESVQTIMNATGKSMNEVQTSLDKIAWFTDETSYEYDSMVANIGRFNAAGVSLEDAEKTMLGIASAAGYFGVNASKATHAMSGFASAIGKGKMDRQSWSWIETAQMNVEGLQQAFMDTGVEMGKLIKIGDKMYQTLDGDNYSVGQFRESLGADWLTTDVMTKTLNKYSKSIDTIYEEYKKFGGDKSTSDIIKELGDQLDATSRDAFRAAQEAKTFKDAWDSVTVAIQSKWRESFRLIIGNYEQAKKLWSAVANELYEVFVASGDVRNELLSGWNESGGRDSLMRAFANFWYGLRAIMDTIKGVWSEIFPPTSVDRLVEITKKFEDFSYKFRSLFDVEATPFVEDIKEVGKATEKIIGPVARTTEVLDDLAMAVIRGDYGNGVDIRREKLEALGYSFELVQNRVNGLMNELYGTNFDPNYYTVPADEIVEASEQVVEAVEETKDAITSVTEIDPNLLGGFRVYTEEEQKLIDQHERAARNTERLSNIFGGLFATVKMVGQIFNELRKRTGELVHAAFGGFAPLLETVLDLLSDFGLTMMNVQKTFNAPEWVDNAFVFIANTIGVASQKIGEFLAMLINAARVYIPRAMHWIRESVGPLFSLIGGWLKTAMDTVTTHLPIILDWITKNIQSFWSTITKGNGVKRLGEVLKGMFDVLAGAGLEGFKKVKEFFSSMFGSDSEKKVDIGKAFADMIDYLAGKVSDFLIVIGGIGQKISDFFGAFKTKKEDTGAIEFVAETLENTGGSLEKASANIGKLQPIVDFFKNLSGYFTVITDFLRDPLAAFGKAMDDYAQRIGEFFSNLTLESVGEKLKDGALGAFLLILAKKLADGAGSIASIPKTFVGILSSIKDVLFAYQQNLNGQALMTTAKAIGLLTLSIIALTFVDPQKLSDTAVALSTVLITFAWAVKAMAGLRNALNVTLGKKNDKKALENQEKAIKEESTAIDKLIKGFVDPIEKFRQGLNASIDKKLNANQWAKGLLMMAVALGILWHQVITPIYDFFSTAPDADQQRMLEVVGIISAYVLGFSTIMAIANHFSGKASVGSALSYVGVAAAMWVLLKTLDPLKNYSTSQLENIQYVIWAFAGLISALGYAIGTITKNSYTEKFESQTWKSTYGATQTAADLLKVLLGLALTITLMMPAFKVIGGMGLGDLGKVALVFLGLAGVIFIIVKITNKMKEFKTEQIKKRFDAIKGVLIITAELAALMTAVGVVAGMDGALEAWGRGLVIMAVSLAAFLGVGYLLSSMPNVADGMEKLAKAFLIFSGAILASIAAFYLLGKAIPAIMDGIASIGERLQDEKFMANFEKAKPVIIKAFLILLGAFATAFVIFKSGVLKKLAGIGGSILDKINTFLGGDLSTKITGLLGGLFKNIGGWLKGLWGAGGFFGKTKILFGLGVLGIVIGGLAILEAACPGMAEKIVKVFVRVVHSVADAIGGNASEIVGAIGHLAKAIGGLLSEALHQALGGLGNLLYDTTQWDWLSPDAGWRKDVKSGWDRLTGWFTGENKKKTQEAKDAVTSRIDTTITAARGTYNKNMGGFNRDVTSGIDNLTNTVQNGTKVLGGDMDMMSFIFGPQMSGMATDMNGNMFDMTSMLSNSTMDMSQIWGDYNFDMDGMVSEYGDIVGVMPGVTQTSMDQTATNVYAGADNVSAAYAYYNDQVGFAQNAAVVTAEQTAAEEVDSYVNTLTEEQLAAVEEVRQSKYNFYLQSFDKKTASMLAEEEVQNYISELKARNVEANKAGENIASEAAKGAKSGVGGFLEAGRNAGEGYATGIKEKLMLVREAAEEMSKAAIERTKIIQMSRSPSRVFAELGLFAVQGYANGFRDNSALAADSAGKMAQSTIDKVREAIAFASGAFAQDWEDGPVITPVLDLSDVRTGVGAINKMTNGTSMNISGKLGEIYTPKRAIMDKLATLDNAMSSVNASLATAGDSSLTIEVPLYMDSKEVAHATAPVVSADIDRMQRNALRRAGKR